MSHNLTKWDLIATHDIVAEDTNHKLIIHTAAGQYIGKLYNSDNKDYEYVSSVIQTFENLRRSKFDENNPAAIFMVDVELRTSSLGGPFKMPYVCLFLDQILGVTMGSYEIPGE